MSVKINSIKCPECNGNIVFEKGLTKFCPYCGSSLLLSNENEYVYRHIDEASIKQSEVELLIRLKELELEEKADERARKGRIIAYIVAFITIAIGALVCINTAYTGAGAFFCVGGAWIALGSWINSTIREENKVKKARKRKR